MAQKQHFGYQQVAIALFRLWEEFLKCYKHVWFLRTDWRKAPLAHWLFRV